MNYWIYTISTDDTTTNVRGITGSGRHDLIKLFGDGRRTTSVANAADRLELSRSAAAKRLAALAASGWLRRIRRGLYLSVPVDVPNPSTWTIDAWFLADIVWSPCYITGWTAANHWSLTDQTFRTTVVATTKRVRRNDHTHASTPFLVHHVPEERLTWGLTSEWREGRRVLVAAPATTVAEMLDDPSLGGGIRHVSEVLAEYLLGHDPEPLLDALVRLGNGAAFKRLGWMLTHASHSDDDLVNACRDHVTKGIVDLDPGLPPVGETDHAWGLRINAAIEP